MLDELLKNVVQLKSCRIEVESPQCSEDMKHKREWQRVADEACEHSSALTEAHSLPQLIAPPFTLIKYAAKQQTRNTKPETFLVICKLWREGNLHNTCVYFYG